MSMCDMTVSDARREEATLEKPEQVVNLEACLENAKAALKEFIGATMQAYVVSVDFWPERNKRAITQKTGEFIEMAYKLEEDFAEYIQMEQHMITEQLLANMEAEEERGRRERL